MRVFIPVDFASLGLVEWLWLVFAGLGLSYIAPPGRRGPAAVLWSAVFLVVAGIRYWALEGDGLSAWNLWGPIVVAPALVAALIVGGERIPKGLGVPVLLLPLLILTAAGRPFGVARLAEWLFLGFLALGLATSLQGPGWLRDVLGRRLGVKAAYWVALAFLLLCGLARPFGAGLAWGTALLVLAGVVRALAAQGPEMGGYVRRRLLGAPVVLLILLVFSFILIRSAPGNPFSSDKNIDPALRELQMEKYNLNKPLWFQFRKYMANVAWKGDLGVSFKQKGQTINEIIGRHTGPSVRLGLGAMALAILLGLTSGIVAGIRQNSIFDYASMASAMLGLALPTFIVGPMLVLAFAIKLDWFNVTGWEEIHFPFPRDLVLPAITLSLPFAARLARLTRAGMLEIINQDYIRTARAKGLSEPAIVIRHTLKGAFLPVVAFLGPAIALVLTGSLVVEKIFGVPGLGREFVESATNRDYPLALGLVILFGTLLVLFNLVVDIAYAFLDPRIRHA